MRAVIGTVFSSEPVSLKRATATISAFVASDTGARPEIAVYSQRASNAFNDLLDLHRQIRAGTDPPIPIIQGKTPPLTTVTDFKETQSLAGVSDATDGEKKMVVGNGVITPKKKVRKTDKMVELNDVVTPTKKERTETKEKGKGKKMVENGGVVSEKQERRKGKSARKEEAELAKEEVSEERKGKGGKKRKKLDGERQENGLEDGMQKGSGGDDWSSEGHHKKKRRKGD